ncbi:MAG: transporter substrate-binding domain-containing protein, partial [Clostridia bacterium]|nr:transporter substrate-binding domain-containing protein [Clostridia bacterium]
GMAGMTVTDERLLEVNFTSSYATGVQVVIVKEGSDIKTLDDLTGKKIGVQLGTTGDIYATDDYGADNVTQYGKGADAVIALKGGDVDAVIIDNEPAKAFVAENEGLVILDTEYAVEDYAIAVKKANTELLDDINDALEALTTDGTIDSIIAKFIKAE